MENKKLILIKSLKDDLIKLRDQIDIDKDITFGIEIEFEYAKIFKILNEMHKEFGFEWINKIDKSLVDGGEVNSPILRDNKQAWVDIEKTCNIISKYASLGDCSSGHIHIGAHILGSDYHNWLNFIKLWATYEHIIFRFSYGEYLNPRPHLVEFAHPMGREFIDKIEKFKNLDSHKLSDLLRMLAVVREQAVNFNRAREVEEFKENSTIEIRCPNGTLNPSIWQNNINFFIKLLIYSKSNDFDSERIDYRLSKNLETLDNISYYNDLHLEDAHELSNLIFKKELDKNNFMVQYLK